MKIYRILSCAVISTLLSDTAFGQQAASNMDKVCEPDLNGTDCPNHPFEIC